MAKCIFQEMSTITERTDYLIMVVSFFNHLTHFFKERKVSVLC